MQGAVQGPDYAVLIGYLILMLGIGAYFYRAMRGMKDYFSGGNQIPWWLSGVSFYMSSFSVTAFIAYPALAYRYGWVGITLLWVAVPATLFSVFLFAKKWRRARIDSPVEYLEARYSPLLRQVFAWQGVPVKIVDDALKLVAIGIFVAVGLSLPEIESLRSVGVLERLHLHRPEVYSMVAAALIMLIYTFLGGLWAVAVTDFIQFIVLSVALVIVLPLSIARVGGVGQFIAHAPDGFFQWTSPEYPWAYIVLLILLYCLAWSSINWSLIQRYYCVPRERDAVKVGWLVVGLYIVGPPLMFLPAMAAQQFLPGIADKDVYPTLCITLLPTGMIGLVIAAMFSATMSMLSSDYNVSASVLTNDVYRRLIRPGAAPRELVLVGRLMTLVIGFLALGVALLMSAGTGENLFRTMVTLFSIATAPVAVPMLLGLLSKKVTNLGAIIGFLLGLGTGLGLYVFFYHVLPQDKPVAVLGGTWDPLNDELCVGDTRLKLEVILFAANTLVTLAATVLVSIVWPMGSEQRARVERFHQRLATPIGDLPEDAVTSPGTATLVSPLRIVGVATVCIGLMMLAILPWSTDTLTFGLDLALGGGLVLAGGWAVWQSRQGV